MIERAVFSYYNSDENFKNKIGFKSFDDLLYTMSLSILFASRHFREVQLIGSTWTIDLLKNLGLPVSEYSVELDKMRGIPKSFWAYGKLLSYELQTKPFIHIDNDVFLYDPLPKRILESELCFQSREYFSVPYYKWYGLLKPCWERASVRPQIIVDNEVTDFVYNCGICGGYNLEFFKKWRQCSAEYILAPENQSLFFEEFRDLLIHQNLFHEQYFGTSLVNVGKNWLFFKKKYHVETIADDINSEEFRSINKSYTHLWGGTKVDQPMMMRVRKRLEKEDTELFRRVKTFCEDVVNVKN